jgi:hypothetical protein
VHLNNLSKSLGRRFDSLQEIDDLDAAISFQEKAISLTPEGHADRPMWLANLGSLLTSRFQRLGRIN